MGFERLLQPQKDGRLAEHDPALAVELRCVAADHRWGLVDKCIVHAHLHHEQGNVRTAREGALEDGVADVSAPNGEAFAFSLLKVAPSLHDSPALQASPPFNSVTVMTTLPLCWGEHSRAEEASRVPVCVCSHQRAGMGVWSERGSPGSPGCTEG